MWNLGKKSGAIVLSTAITPNYLRKAADFIRSINENSNCDANVVILVCGIESLNTELLEIFNSISFARYFKKIKLRLLNNSKVLAKNKINCIQHGAFFSKININDSSGDDDPIIIFTDADIIMQRGLNEEEKAFLKTLKKGDFYVGMNESEKETLEDEAFKLGADQSFVKKLSKEIKRKRIFNTGVMAAKKSTFKKLYNIYANEYPVWETHFKHYAKQQWIISYIIQSYSFFKVIEMPSSFHSHCHRPPALLPNQDTFIDNNGILKMTSTKIPVLFNHLCCKLFGEGFHRTSVE